jgi:hypothetical protein
MNNTIAKIRIGFNYWKARFYGEMFNMQCSILNVHLNLQPEN